MTGLHWKSAHLVGGHPPLNRERDMRRNGTCGAKFFQACFVEKQAIFALHSVFASDPLAFPVERGAGELIMRSWKHYLLSRMGPFFAASLLALTGRRRVRFVSIRLDDWLSRGAHRSFLSRTDRRHDLSARWQLWNQPSRRGKRRRHRCAALSSKSLVRWRATGDRRELFMTFFSGMERAGNSRYRHAGADTSTAQLGRDAGLHRDGRSARGRGRQPCAGSVPYEGVDFVKEVTTPAPLTIGTSRNGRAENGFLRGAILLPRPPGRRVATSSKRCPRPRTESSLTISV